MKLESVYRHKESVKILYLLLEERTVEQSISHKSMPTYQEHEAFVESKPYHVWYLIVFDERYVGSIYLTKQREIGVFIFNKFKGNGFGGDAIRLLMEKWPGKFLANINPDNLYSIELFKKLGFNQIQVTYALNSR